MSLKILQFLCSGQNKPKIFRTIWTPGIKKLRAPLFFSFFFFGFDFSNRPIFYRLCIRYRNKPTFSRTIWAFGLTILWASPNFESNWPEGLPTSTVTPVFVELSCCNIHRSLYFSKMTEFVCTKFSFCI